MDSELEERIRIRCDEKIPYIIHSASQLYKTSDYPMYYTRALQNVSNERIEEITTKYGKIKQGNFRKFKFIDSLSHEVPIIFHSQQAVLDLIEMMFWKVYLFQNENRMDEEWQNELLILLALVQFRADFLIIYKQKKANMNSKDDNYAQEIGPQAAGAATGEEWMMVTMNFLHDVGALLDQLTFTIRMDNNPKPTIIEPKTPHAELETYKEAVYYKFLRKANVTTITVLFQDYYASRVCTDADRMIYFRQTRQKIADKELMERKNTNIFNMPDPAAISTIKDLWNWTYFDDFIMHYAYKQQHFCEIKIKINITYSVIKYKGDDKYYYSLSEICYRNNLLKIG